MVSAFAVLVVQGSELSFKKGDMIRVDSMYDKASPS